MESEIEQDELVQQVNEKEKVERMRESEKVKVAKSDGAGNT